MTELNVRSLTSVRATLQKSRKRPLRTPSIGAQKLNILVKFSTSRSLHFSLPPISGRCSIIINAMSRLIVKNLPAYLTQDRLRKYFEAPEGPGGTLTDVKLVLKPDGTSRRFGFIGYKSSPEAERAKKWFNKSFIDSSRIAVDVVDVGCFLSCMVSPNSHSCRNRV